MTRGQIWQKFPKLPTFMALFPSLKSHVCAQNFGHSRTLLFIQPLKKTKKLLHYTTLFCTISFEAMLLLVAT